jgi:PIN domain nuclease of toxin-antitoxin system
MANKHVIDTHALIWYLEGNSKLGAAARAVMDDPVSDLVLPAIALAEAMYIVDKGRTAIPTVSQLLNDVMGDTRIEILPLTLPILQQSLRANVVPEMHDRLIVAATLYLKELGHSATILTKDPEISAFAQCRLFGK